MQKLRERADWFQVAPEEVEIILQVASGAIGRAVLTNWLRTHIKER